MKYILAISVTALICSLVIVTMNRGPKNEIFQMFQVIKEYLESKDQQTYGLTAMTNQEVKDSFDFIYDLQNGKDIDMALMERIHKIETLYRIEF